MPAIGEKLISPLSVRFTQDHVRLMFRDGRPVEETIPQIESGLPAGPYDVVLRAPFPPIEVVRWKPHVPGFEHESSGLGPTLNDTERHWFTFDNRRLYCLQRAAVDLWPRRVAVVAEVHYATELPEVLRRYDSTSQGRSVSVAHASDAATGLWDWTETLAVKLGPQRLAYPDDSDRLALEAIAADDAREGEQELEHAPTRPSMPDLPTKGLLHTVVRPTLVQAGVELSTGNIGQLSTGDVVEVLEVQAVAVDRRIRGKILCEYSSNGIGWSSLRSTEDESVWAQANDGTTPFPTATVAQEPPEQLEAQLGEDVRGQPLRTAVSAVAKHKGEAEEAKADKRENDEWKEQPQQGEEEAEQEEGVEGEEKDEEEDIEDDAQAEWTGCTVGAKSSKYTSAAKWAAHREARIAGAKAVLDGEWMGDKGETYTMLLEHVSNGKTTWTCTRWNPWESTQSKRFTITYDRGLIWWGLARAYFADPEDVERGAGGQICWYAGANEGQKRKPRFTWRRPPGWKAPQKISKKGERNEEAWCEEDSTWHNSAQRNEALHDDQWQKQRGNAWHGDMRWSRRPWEGWDRWEASSSSWRP